MSRSLKRPRIVFLIENMSFPRDPRVRREATALKEHGCDVSVICPKGETHDTGSFEVLDGIKVYRYRQFWQGQGVFSYLAEYTWAMAWTLVLICRIWITDGFDTLHAANPPDLLCLVAFPFILVGKKFVYDQHDLCPELWHSRLHTVVPLQKTIYFFERLSYKLASLVIVTNRSAYDAALARGAKSGRVYIVRNGPELGPASAGEARADLKGSAQYLAVYIGSIAPQDGVDRFVRAAHHIVHTRRRPDVTFAILGDGDSLKDIEALASTLQVEPYIRFCGWLEGREFHTYLATADVCLAPEPPEEFNQRSSFIKLTDYMSHGRVTVSFDLIESRRTLGSAGIFVEHDDPALFGDAILEILDNSARRRELGAAAAARLQQSFHWGLSREVLLDAYKTVIWNRASLAGSRGKTAKSSTREDVESKRIAAEYGQIGSTGRAI